MKQQSHNCCSNSLKKSLFPLKTSKCACAVLCPRLKMLTVSIATGTYNDSCSDAMTLPISDGLFYSKGGTSFVKLPHCALHFFSIQNYTSDTSWIL